MNMGVRGTGKVTTGPDGIKTITDLSIDSFNLVHDGESKPLHARELEFEAFVRDEEKIYVLYHKNCQDGCGARTAANLRFGHNATYIPVQYREPMPELESGAILYIVDFSYPRDVLEELNARMKKLVVLDHHKTSMQDLKGLPYAFFDMSKSGAVIAWEYFWPDTSIPEIIKLVQDRDLWKFNFGDLTRVTHAGMQLYRDDFPAWRTATKDNDIGKYFLTKVRGEGDVILRYEKVLLKQALERVKVIPFLDTHVAIVNSSILKDEIGGYVNTHTEEYPVTGCITYTLEQNSMLALLSFRGPAGGYDWSVVAKAFNGGGHATSCNGTVDLETLDQILEGRLKRLPRKTWVGRIRTWINNKLRLLEEALH